MILSPPPPHLEEIERLTSDAVRNVFQTMLSMEVAPRSPVSELSNDVEIISSVGFIGEITGSIYLCSNTRLARFVTSRMLGLEDHEIDSDSMINDAFGELGN